MADLTLSIFESATVSERTMVLLPALSQADLDITSGSTYRLTFDATITTGILKVYQGTQLIYTSDIVHIGAVNTLYDTINVTEHLTLDKRTSFSVNDSVTVSEAVTLTIFFPLSVNDSVTVSENITLSIV